MSLPLACTVRGCGLPLARRDRAYACPSGHTFDIARSGYVNLLQPQDRRSGRAGDSRETVDARAALEAAGVGRGLVEALVQRVAALEPPDDFVVLDLGSGTGELLRQISARRRAKAIGIDLSAAAVGFAAHRSPEATWVVANADRRLPLQDHSVDMITSVHARRNPSECARVLRPTGMLLVAVPAPDDLIELRERVQGRAMERDRVDAVLQEHRPHLVLQERVTITERVELDRAELAKLLRGSYRGARFASRERVEALARMTVTTSSEIVVFRCRDR